MHFSLFHNFFKRRRSISTICNEELELIYILRKIPKEIKQNIIDFLKSFS